MFVQHMQHRKTHAVVVVAFCAANSVSESRASCVAPAVGRMRIESARCVAHTFGAAVI